MALHAQYKDGDCNISFKWYQNDKGKLEYSKDKMVYQFIPGSGSWKVVLRNTSTEDIAVNWKNAEFTVNGMASGVCMYPPTIESQLTEETVKSNSEMTWNITAAKLVTDKKVGKDI
ncbi:MAG: hypothetical protein LUE99_12865 [Bacteroides sp.]|nr:hypothetical protein [Bacteroides sp.]